MLQHVTKTQSGTNNNSTRTHNTSSLMIIINQATHVCVHRYVAAREHVSNVIVIINMNIIMTNDNYHDLIKLLIKVIIANIIIE